MSTTTAPNSSSFNQLHATSLLNLSAGIFKEQMNSLPALKSDLLLNDTGLFTVYHFIKNFIG